MSDVALLFGREAQAPAHALEIASFEARSATERPGQTVAVVRLQGCAWRCTYCNTVSLQGAADSVGLDWLYVRGKLAALAGQVDAVVFTGGEPTRQAALLPALDEVRSMGHRVVVHTAGAHPSRLGALLGSIDSLVLDIKAMPEGYHDITGKAGAGAKAWESLEAAIAWAGPLEVRLTVDPTTHTRESVLAVVRRVVTMGGPAPILQEAHADGASPEFVTALAGRGIADVLEPDDLLGLDVRR